MDMYDEGFMDEDTNLVPHWMMELSPAQRTELAHQIILTLPVHNVVELNERILPIIHRDFVLLFPDEIVRHIFSFLPVDDLISASLVSKRWSKHANHAMLWKSLYARQGWKCNEAVVAKLEQILSDASSMAVYKDTPDVESLPRLPHPFEAKHIVKEDNRYLLNWKYLYIQHHRLDQNWRNGQYSIYTLCGPDSPSGSHEEGIYCLQFDRDYVVSGSRDRTIKIWNYHTKELQMSLHGHTGSVLCLQFSGPEGIIMSGSSDTSIIIWNMYTGRLLHRLSGHTESVLSLKFTDDYIVSCSRDRTISIWDRHGSEGVPVMLRKLWGHRAAVNSMHLDEAGRRIISASGDRTIRVWDFDTGTCLRSIEGHARGVACIQLCENIVVAGSSDLSIRLFDINTGECINTLKGHDGLVRTLQADGRKIVSGSYDQSIKVWGFKAAQAKSGPLSAPFATASAASVPASARGRDLWCDLKENGHTDHIYKLQYDECKIISCSADRCVLVWEFSIGVDTCFF